MYNVELVEKYNKSQKAKGRHARNVGFFCIRKINIREKICKQCGCSRELDDLKEKIERLKGQLNSKT